MKKGTYYTTYAEASAAARQLGITSSFAYNRMGLYSQDPLLPCNPDKIYHTEWTMHGGWYGFLGKQRGYWYATLAEARRATQKLGIRTMPEYRKRHHEDPMLPSNPWRTYGKRAWKEGGGFYGYFGRKPPRLYVSISQATRAIRKYGWTTASRYHRHRCKDPRLPANPRQHFGTAAWEAAGKWQGYLGKA